MRSSDAIVIIAIVLLLTLVGALVVTAIDARRRHKAEREERKRLGLD